TETAAPAGYQLDATPRNLVIPVGTGQTTNVFVNLQFGSLTVTKITNGGTGTFTFHVDCDGTAYDQDVHITDSGSQTISNIPTGTSCTVTEASNSLFSSVVVPANGTVTIGADGATVTFTNTRITGSLTITKAANAAGSFTFDVNCTDDAFDRSNVSAGPG